MWYTFGKLNHVNYLIISCNVKTAVTSTLFIHTVLLHSSLHLEECLESSTLDLMKYNENPKIIQIEIKRPVKLKVDFSEGLNGTPLCTNGSAGYLMQLSAN